MATDKRKLVMYVSPDIDIDLEVLYAIWRKKQISRKVVGVASKSKFVEWILKRYVISEGVRIYEEKRAVEIEKQNTV